MRKLVFLTESKPVFPMELKVVEVSDASYYINTSCYLVELFFIKIRVGDDMHVKVSLILVLALSTGANLIADDNIELLPAIVGNQEERCKKDLNQVFGAVSGAHIKAFSQADLIESPPDAKSLDTWRSAIDCVEIFVKYKGTYFGVMNKKLKSALNDLKRVSDDMINLIKISVGSQNSKSALSKMAESADSLLEDLKSIDKQLKKERFTLGKKDKTEAQTLLSNLNLMLDTTIGALKRAIRSRL